MHNTSKSRTRLGWILAWGFLGVMLMGPGPGMLLINPDPTDPASPATFLGLPVIYLWGLFWYGMQLAILIVAYRYIWRYDDGETESQRK